MYFLIHPLVWINGERMAVHCLESGCIGLHIPSDLKISLGPRDVPQASPPDISRASRNLFVDGDVLPNTSLLSAVYGYNTSLALMYRVYFFTGPAQKSSKYGTGPTQ